MLLPHIHREGLRHWHLQDRGTKVRQENKPLLPLGNYLHQRDQLFGGKLKST